MPDHELLHLTCLMLNSTPIATALLLSESILSISQAHTIINFEIYTIEIFHLLIVLAEISKAELTCMHVTDLRINH